jgi:hypothetical protein
LCGRLWNGPDPAGVEWSGGQTRNLQGQEPGKTSEELIMKERNQGQQSQSNPNQGGQQGGGQQKPGQQTQNPGQGGQHGGQQKPGQQQNR